MKNKNTYYWQIFLSILSVCFFVTLLTSIFSFFHFSKNLIDISYEDNKKNLATINDQVNDLLNLSSSIALENRAFRDASEICTKDFTTIHSEINNYYNELKQISSDIDTIFISSNQLDYFIGKFPYDQLFFCKFGTDIDPILTEPFLLHNTVVTRFVGKLYDNKSYLFTQTPLFSSNYSVIGNINCGISLDRIKGIIQQNSIRTLGEVLLLDEQGALIYPSSSELFSSSFDLSPYLTHTDTIHIVNYKEESYLLCTDYTDNTQYTLLSVVPKSIITSGVVSTVLFNALQTMGLCIILALCMSYFLSKQLYTPIQYIVDSTKKLYHAESNKNELLFIQQAIEHMHLSNHNLNQIIEQNKHVLQYQYLCSLIYDKTSIVPVSPLFQFQHEFFTSALIRIEFTLDSQNPMLTSLQISALITKLDYCLEEIFPNIKSFQTLQNDILLIFNEETTNNMEETLKSNLIPRLESLLQDTGFFDVQSINIGVGSTVNQLESLSDSYDDALYALNYAIFNRTHFICIVFYSQLEGNSMQRIELSLVQRRLIGLCLKHDFDSINVCLDQLLESFQTSSTYYSMDDINEFFLMIISENNRQASQASAKIACAIKEKNMIIPLLSKHSLEDKVKYLKVYFKDLIQISCNASTTHLSATEKKVFKACEYLEEHYMDDLSLQEVSDMVDLNYTYFSNSFKIIKGVKFIEYLNHIRLTHAVEMMCNPELNLNDISGKCGFLSQQRFATVFKSFYNCSPSQYRKEHFTEK